MLLLDKMATMLKSTEIVSCTDDGILLNNAVRRNWRLTGRGLAPVEVLVVLNSEQQLEEEQC